MVAVLEIRMLPTGQVVGVRVVKSSGDAAFDRSAEQAVKKVDRFEEVKNIPPDIFEKKYRQFTFTFNPEDLRRWNALYCYVSFLLLAMPRRS